MYRNNIKKCDVASLGYNFIDPQYIPEGSDEYFLRNMQNRSGIDYRNLTAFEIEVLVRNGNTCDDWNNFLVSDAFNPELVKNCKFFGLNRIGKLEPYYLEFSDLKVAIGLYNSTIISCDFGNDVVIQNVNYLSHYIIGDEVIIINVNELSTTNYSKFGNGILKEGEDENTRIWLELSNENGGRKVIPFTGMLPGDAWLWSKYREDDALLEKFKIFTQNKFDKQRGYYGKVGDRTVIKNCKIVKDTWIGSDAYLKGANKLKNLTINSGPHAPSQIGEGCELVNGIMDYGCKVFYGVKAVRFIMASHSQLKYGARLINSYLGNNATISCCEVLNSLIFPAHEQHHNNSFLCAAVIMGQSNLAAGATIGSNHNSRGADGEIIANRGFWPGLCVSLKHNSKFASFTMLAKGDFPAELNIQFPFSLVSNEVSTDKLVIMPGYWFFYNMYALARNTSKLKDRDKRTEKIQHIEYDYLAPDTVNELFTSIQLLEVATGKSYNRKFHPTQTFTVEEHAEAGRMLLASNSAELKDLVITIDGFENSKRICEIRKAPQAYRLFKELITYYGTIQLIEWIEENNLSFDDVHTALKPDYELEAWHNVGGQLLPDSALRLLKHNVTSGIFTSWDDVHGFYVECGQSYLSEKRNHAIASLLHVLGIGVADLSASRINSLVADAVKTKEWMTKGIEDSRTKDYTNPFRKMVYDNRAEMDKVLGKLSENAFINQQKEELVLFKNRIKKLDEANISV